MTSGLCHSDYGITLASKKKGVGARGEAVSLIGLSFTSSGF